MNHKQGPLAGVRIMDLGIMGAGPWTNTLLGMLGAEVIKIESPSGDIMRKYEPLQRGMGSNFLVLNMNKTSVTLDLKQPDDLKRALDLAATSDVFLQNFRVGVIDRIGLGYEALRKLNPRLVHCSISGFGEVGPLAKAGCIDTIMQAFSGFASLNGAFGGELEAFRFTSFIDLVTAAVTTQAILAALVERDVSGEGQKVEVSMLEASLELQCTRLAELLGAGQVPVPRGSQSAGLVPDGAFQALDQEIFVTVHNDAQWQGLCRALERPDLGQDARYGSTRQRVAQREALNEQLGQVFRQKPAIWWLRVLRREGVSAGLAHNFETFRYHEQVVQNGMLARVDTEAWGEVVVGGLPWHFERTPCAVRAPQLANERTAETLAALAPPAPRKVRKDARGLSGLQVVEFAEGVSGPLAALRLGDLGAEVVKVESAQGDWLRGAAPVLPGTGTSAAFAELNRGKRSVQAGDGRGLRELLQSADVFITDRTEEELKALGIVLDKLPERLIVISVSAWGRYGPWSGESGSELTVQAMAGYTRYLGAHGEASSRLGADVAGAATGIFGCQAALAALLERNVSGRGQRIDLSLLNSLITLKSVHMAAQAHPDSYTGPRIGGAYYPPDRGWKAGDGRLWMMFGGAGTEGRAGWSDFVKEVGLAHLLDDERFQKNGRNSTGHGLNAHELHGEYERAFVNYTCEQLVALIRKHMGNVAMFQNAEQALGHEQTQALGVVRTVPAGHGGDGNGELRVRAFPARFSRLHPRLRGGVPAPGADTTKATRATAHRQTRTKTVSAA